MNSLEALKTTINFYSGNEYSSKSEEEKKSVDARFRTGWLNKYNQEKANGTLPQELAGYDPEQLYDHFVNEAKKSNPGLSEFEKAKANVDRMNSHEYANNVIQYKSTPGYQNLSDEDKAKYNQHFNKRLTQKRIAEDVPVDAQEMSNSNISRDLTKEWLNIEPENQPTETVKDLGFLGTAGKMVKGAAKSLARGVPGVISTGLGAAGYASDVLGKTTGIDYLSDQGEMLSTLGNALDTYTRNILPPEQKSAESLDEMLERGLGGNLIALADEAPEQLLTWVMPYLISSRAVKAVELAKKGAGSGKIMTAVNRALAKLSPEKAAKYAGLLGSAGVELSEIHKNEIQEEGRMNSPWATTAAGIAAGAMENAVPSGFQKLSNGWSKATRKALSKAASSSKELAKFALSQGAKDFITEFSTEAAQTAIEQMAVKYNSKGNTGLGEKCANALQILKAEGITGLAQAALQDNDIAEIFDAAVVGGVTGGLGGTFHGVVDPVSYRASDVGKYYDYIRQRAEAIDAKDYDKLNAAEKAYSDYSAGSMGLQALNGQMKSIINSFQDLVSDETSPEDKVEAMEVLSDLNPSGYAAYKNWLAGNGMDFTGQTFLDNEKALNDYMKQRAKNIVSMTAKALGQSAQQATENFNKEKGLIDKNVYSPLTTPAAPQTANQAAPTAPEGVAATTVDMNDKKERDSYLDSLVNSSDIEMPADNEVQGEEPKESLNGLFSDERKDVLGSNYNNMGKPAEVGRGFIGNQADIIAGDVKTTCHYAILCADDVETNAEEVQPRDRAGRKASDDQIVRLAINFEPDRVIDNSIDANNGPVVVIPVRNEKGEIVKYRAVSGNGRTNAIKMMYDDQSGESDYSGAQFDKLYGKAQQLQQRLTIRAKEFGISGDNVMATPKPMLVRVLDDEKLNMFDFAVKANNSQNMVMSASEQAKVDAGLMRDFVDNFSSMNLDSAANVPFLKKFLERVCSPSELNDMFDSNQQHLSANGKTRILNALFAAAYGDDPEILSMLSEVGDPVISKLINALKEAAADTVKLAGDVKNGLCYNVPIAKAIGEAVRKIRDIKNDPKLQGVIKTHSVADAYFKQGLISDDGMSPAGRLFLAVFGGDMANNVKTMSDFVIDCNNVIRKSGNPNQPMLDGTYAPAPSAEDVIAAALRNNGYDQQIIDAWKKGPVTADNANNNIVYSVKADGITENQFHKQKWEEEYSKNNPDMKQVHNEYDLANGESMPANRATFANDDIDFDEEMRKLEEEEGTAITREELEEKVKEIRKKIDPESGITIEVRNNPTEDFGDKAPAGGEAYNLDGHVVLYADNLTQENWMSKLVHEVLGHSTAKMLLGGRHFKSALEGALQFAKNNAKAKAVFHDILVRYQKMYLDHSRSQRREDILEEFLADCFAHLSDNKNYFGRTSIFDRIRAWVRGKMRNWGMNVKVSDLELRDLFRKSMEVVTPEGSWKSGPYKAAGRKTGTRWSADDDGNALGEFDDAMSRIDQPEKKPYTSRAVESIKEVEDESDSNGLGLAHDGNDNIRYDRNGKPEFSKVLKTKYIAINGRTDSEDSLELAYRQAGENVPQLENLCSAVERETGYKKHMRDETHFKEDVKAKLKELGLSEVEGIRAAKAGRIQDKDLATELLKKDERDIGNKWKGHPRANQKRQFDYENDAARVVDLIGGTISIPQSGSYKEAIDSIKRNLPSGASVDKVKKFNMKPTDKGYQDIKVSVRFPNGGIGEIIIAEDIMADAKENRGGHTCYEIRRELYKSDAFANSSEMNDCYYKFQKLEDAIYNRAGYDLEEFSKLKAIASDSLTRLLGNASLTSSADMKLLKSLSSKLHLCAPYSPNSNATPALSEIKYDISETSDNGDNSDLSSTSSITENEKNRHYQTEEDEMAQILAYLQNLGSQRDVAEDVLQKAKETGDKKHIEEAEAALARTEAARKGSEIMKSEMDRLYGDLVRAAEGGDEDARARAERMADRQLESRGYNREQSEQIKKRGITYDDDGRLIPLSSRGDKNREDTRWSVADKRNSNNSNRQREEDLKTDDELFDEVASELAGWFDQMMARRKDKQSGKARLSSEDRRRWSIIDDEYLKAVDSEDEETARRMVAKIANTAGYTTKLYHGTPAFGFTKIETDSYSDDGVSFFAVDTMDTANSYANDAGKRKIMSSFQDSLGKYEELVNEYHKDHKSVLRFLDERNIEYSTREGRHPVTQKITTLVRIPAFDEAYDEFEGSYSDVLDRLLNQFEIKDGVYELYANTDNLLMIDGEGRNWNNIPLGQYEADFMEWAKGKRFARPSTTTRILCKYAKARGYDGIAVANLIDDGGRSKNSGRIKPATVYAFFKPQQQIKSADPVTYDNKGKVIKLSERFNPENNDIRWSIGNSRKSDNEYEQMLLDFENGYNDEETGEPRYIPRNKVLEAVRNGDRSVIQDIEDGNLVSDFTEQEWQSLVDNGELPSGRQSRNIRKPQKAARAIAGIFPNIEAEYEYDEMNAMPPSIEALGNISEDLAADLDAALNEGDMRTAEDIIRRVRDMYARTFFEPLAEKLTRRCDHALDMLASGRYRKIRPLSFEEVADAPVRRMTHSVADTESWREGRREYNNARAEREPSRADFKRYAAETRRYKEGSDFAKMRRDLLDLRSQGKISDKEYYAEEKAINDLEEEFKRNGIKTLGQTTSPYDREYNIGRATEEQRKQRLEYLRKRKNIGEHDKWRLEQLNEQYPPEITLGNADMRVIKGPASQFKPRWSVSEKTLRNLSREDTDTITQRAVEELGTTDIWEGAGYLMPDGRLLDFSESNDGGFEGERSMDHRQIGRFYDYVMDNAREEATAYLVDFMNRGNIRCQNGGFELSQKPTYEQRKTLRRFIAEHNDEPIYVDFAAPDGRTEHSVTYEGEEPSRILADISRYYDDGLKPEGTDTESRWSVNSNSDSDQREGDFDSESETPKDIYNKYVHAVKHLGDTDELRNILQTAIKNNTLGKAPNGKKSKLEPAQWLMVRTRNFKRWFGNWNYDPNTKVNAVDLSDYEFTDKDGNVIHPQTSKDLKEWFKDYINDFPVRIKSDGNLVFATMGKFGDSLKRRNRKGQEVQRDAYKALKAIIENAVYYSFEENDGQSKHRGLLGQDIYYSAIKFGDKTYSVRLKLDASTEGDTYKDHKIREVNLSVFHSTEDKSNYYARSKFTSDLSISQLIQDVNQNKISKVVDENGEPLVVHHGTSHKFNEFKKEYIGSNYGADDVGFFFTNNRGEASQSARDSYYRNDNEDAEEIIVDGFLRMNNPLVINTNSEEYADLVRRIGDSYPSMVFDNAKGEILSQFYDGKHDGLIIKQDDWYKDIHLDSKMYMVTDSNQIKSPNPVTKDDNNNIIPLSERFTQKKDIRWSVNQNLDSEYEAALSSGDDEKAMEMLTKVAKAAGYSGKVYWHGDSTGKNIDEFTGNPEITEGDNLNQIKGYFSDQQSYASEYGDTKPYFLDTSNFLYVQPVESVEEMEDYLRNHGVDDIEFNDLISDNEYIQEQIDDYGNINPWDFFNSAGGNLTQKIKAAGYDGLYWDEGIGNDNGIEMDATSYMPFDSARIKSAELRTVDNEGNTIPLSQRFNRQKDSVRWSLKAATPEEKQTLKDLGFSDQELENDPIPTVTEEGRAGAETLVTVANQIIEGLIGDTRSVADRSKPDYLYHKAKQPDKTIETEFEMKRRNKIEKSMKQRTAEDGLILEHLDADRNLITGLIRKHIPAGALQDWALKKAARILAPFQAAKPVEAILYTIADNLMYDEAKKEMVIAPKRKPLDFSKKPVRYEYDPNTDLGTAALKYFHTLNDDFKKIIIDRAKKNNEYRKDFLERVIPYEKAKTYLALFGRTKLNGVSEATIEGRSRQAYNMISNLEGKIDQIDYNNLMAAFEQINNLGNEQIGRQAGNINRIIADLVGNPNASATSLQDRIDLLNTNKGIYGYVHHHMNIDPKDKAGKAFNALGKLGHPWLETVPGFNKSRSGYDGTKSLLIADIARSTKGITAEAANRWMADAEDQRGIPVDLINDPDKELPAGYEKHQIVIANFGRYRGKQIYMPDELFDTYKLVSKHEDLDAALRPFGEACDFINESINRVNGAMLYATSKAARDLMAVPFHLIEFLRDWSIKHPSEAYPAIKALWHGLKNSVSPEFWQSHTPESLGEYSESLIYNTDRKDKTWITRMFDSIGNIFQKSVPVGSTLAAALGELNLSGAADIPLKRVLTTVGEDLADQRGLKGQERERFIYDLVNEYAFDTSDLPRYLAYLRGQYPTQMSSTLGAISRATVPFFGYTSRILKQMITDPVKKGMIPLAKRAFGKGEGSIYDEMANASRPFFWLALKALLASGLAGLLPWPKDEDESAAAHIQNAPGLDARARTQGRFYSGSSDNAEYWTSVKGMGHLEVADSLSDYITGKADTKDFAAEFLTIHPVISAMLHTIHYSSPYEESVSTWAKWGKTLAQIISPEWSTRFGPDLAKLIRMIARTNTIPENRKQNFFTAFFEQIGLPVGAVQYDRSGKLKTTKPALEALKMMGFNVREIPFDIIRDTTKTELKRLESDSKKVQKLRDYRAGKYGSKSEMEFLKQDFGGDFRSVAEAEDYYSGTAKREAGLVKTAVKLNKKGYWNDPEEELRLKREIMQQHKAEAKRSKRRTGRRRKTVRPERPLLATETKRINDNINRAIEYDQNEDLAEFNNLMDQIETGSSTYQPTGGAAEQIEELLSEM